MYILFKARFQPFNTLCIVFLVPDPSLPLCRLVFHSVILPSQTVHTGERNLFVREYLLELWF